MYNSPYEVNEKLRILELLTRQDKNYVSRRYHISIRTLYRWQKLYDGTISSLENKSHKPLTEHPKALKIKEKKLINRILKKVDSSVGFNELYYILTRRYNFERATITLYRYLRKRGYYSLRKKEKRLLRKYDTPKSIAEKWQLDVKIVPYNCRTLKVPFDKNFYQYTIIDEATRERYIFAYDEQNANNTIDFLSRAIKYFGYKPKIIQTDNGQEFCYLSYNARYKKHLLDIFCESNNIIHKRIKPRTPQHNGKVERSHRNDSERFYKYLSFDSLSDLREKMEKYLTRSNNIPTRALAVRINNRVVYLTPREYRTYLTGEVF